MADAHSTERIHASGNANAVHGTVYWNPVKSLWLTSMTIVGFFGGFLTFSWDALAVFFILTGATICAGHSVGMHRLLIHRSFKTHIWIEHFFVYLGVLVGMAGPHGMMKLHDFRDWGQRQTDCHPFFAHTAGFWKDAWWQLHCSILLDDEPEFIIEERVRNDRFYRFLEATWMWQQLPLAMILFVFGGVAWVVWGVVLRVPVSLIGHWLVGYYAHQPKEQLLHVENTCVQGYNLPKLGLITFGEAFHENHHAYPSSAKLGFFKGETDLGWWLIQTLRWFRLVSDVNTPKTLNPRKGLIKTRETVSEAPNWLRRLSQSAS